MVTDFERTCASIAIKLVVYPLVFLLGMVCQSILRPANPADVQIDNQSEARYQYIMCIERLKDVDGPSWYASMGQCRKLYSLKSKKMLDLPTQ
ncbi:hypothetical protein D3C79_847300 [compost metagenome]